MHKPIYVRLKKNFLFMKNTSILFINGVREQGLFDEVQYELLGKIGYFEAPTMCGMSLNLSSSFGIGKMSSVFFKIKCCFQKRQIIQGEHKFWQYVNPPTNTCRVGKVTECRAHTHISTLTLSRFKLVVFVPWNKICLLKVVQIKLTKRLQLNSMTRNANETFL